MNKFRTFLGRILEFQPKHIKNVVFLSRISKISERWGRMVLPQGSHPRLMARKCVRLTLPLNISGYCTVCTRSVIFSSDEDHVLYWAPVSKKLLR